MRIKDGFIIRKIVDEILIVPVGERISDFNGIISVNETGIDLWEALKNDVTEKQLIDLLLENYEVDEQTAVKDVAVFLGALKEHGLIIE